MSLFGQPQNTSGGLFGANSSTGGAFGGTSGGGGLFGANSSSGGAGAFGGGGFNKANSQPNQQTSGFGMSFGVPSGQGAQGGGGLFGNQGQTQGMGGQNQMGFGQNTSGGLFGGQNKQNGIGLSSQPSFGGGGGFGSIANASTQGFGQQTQGMGMTSSGFGQSTSAFGGQQSQGIGGVSSFNSGKSSFFNQANTQNSSPAFGQQSQGFGFNTQNPQSQPAGTFGQAPGSIQGGLFGSNTSSTGFSGAGSFSSNFNSQNQGQQGTPPYSRQPEQTLNTINYQYNPVSETPQPGGNTKSDQTIKLLSLRGDAKYSQCSHEMLKVLDMFAMKNQQVQNYEHKAMQDFNQNSQQYQLLQQMQQVKNASRAGQPQTTTNSFSAGSSFSQGLQQQQTSQFGANPQGAGLFGQNKPQGTGLLGGIGQQPQNNPLGSGGGLFGQDQKSGTGLFGAGQQANPQNTGQGLFGAPSQGGQQQPAQGGGGLFSTPGFNQPGQTGTQGATGGGGLFGAPAQPAGQSSLFNRPATTFGSASQTGGTGGGLFGASQQPQQTSLFGSSQPAAQNPAGGGSLFGAPAQPAGQSSLFNKPQSTFGTAQQPAAGGGGGLFGTSQPQGGGLFGQAPNPAGGGLFGASAQPAAGTQGLFGQKTPAAQNTGLFGAQSAPQQATTPGLFGQQPQGGFQQVNPGQAPEGPTPGGINLEAFYRFNDPFGLEDSTQNEANKKAAQDELKTFIENLNTANNPWDEAYDVLEKNEPLMSDFRYTPGQTQGQETPGIIYSTCAQLETRQQEKYQAKYGAGSLYELQRNETCRKLSQKQTSKGYKDLRALSNLYSANSSVYAFPSMSSAMDPVQDDLLYPKRPSDSKNFNKPDLSKRWQEVQEGSYMDQTTTPGNESKPSVEGCITITVVFVYEESDPSNKNSPTVFPEQSYQMLINKSRDVSDVWACTKGWLQQEFNFNEERGQTIQLYLEGKEISQDLTLQDAGMTTDTKIYVKVEHGDELAESERKAREKAEQESLSRQSLKNDAQAYAAAQKPQFAPKDRLPKGPKDGYLMSPTMLELCRMTLEELQNVEGFQIWNDHGAIEFLDKVDLTDVDLADIVTIDGKGAEVYDDERHHDKPEVGNKINVKSLIRLNNIRPKPNQTATDKEKKLRQCLERQEGATHISYDGDRFIWEFKVDHYTRWGDDSEDDEDMDKETHSIEEAKNIDPPIVTSMINDRVLKGIAPPFESITNRIEESLSQSLDNQSMAADSESQCFDEKKRLLEDDSQKSQADSMIIHMKNNSIFNEQQDMATNAIRASHESQQQYAARIRARILQKDREFKECNPMDRMGIRDKPTNKETMDFLKTLTAKPKVAKTSLFQTPRPCFHPSGGILFTQGSKVSIIPVKQIDSVDKPYQPSQVLGKPDHVTIDTKLGQQLENLNISDSQMDYEAVKLHHKDGGVFDTPVPAAHLIQSNNQPTTKGLTKFLFDLAEELAAELKVRSQSEYKRKMSHEFFLICMFGALFGNPNIPLVQLHPDYVGPNTLQRMLARYGEQNILDTPKLVLEKQRRNAATEVLKLHNSFQFSPSECPVPGSQSSNDTPIYQRAQDLLLNGQIREAVRHLNSHKKTRLSLLLSQVVNSGMPRQMLQQQVQNIYQTGQMNPKLKEILAMVTDDQYIGHQLPWQKELMRNLLFTENPTTDFQTIVSRVAQLPSFQNCENLMWSCIKLHCRAVNGERDFEEWQKNITASHGNTVQSSRDYRLKWIAQQVVGQWISIERATSDIQYALDEDYMVGTSCKYISQLLFEKDWKTALQVALLMPDAKQHHSVIKAKTLFNILCMLAPELVLKPQADIDIIVSKLKLPEKWLATSLALCYQNFQLNEKAMDEWVRADDLNSAHSIFYTRVLPLYMQKSIAVSFEKALQQSGNDTIMQPTKKAWIENNALCLGSQDLIQWAQRVNLDGAQIDLFSQRTGLFIEFIKLVESLKEDYNQEHAIYSLQKVNSMQKALSSARGDLSDVIHRFISQELDLIKTGLTLFLQRIAPERALVFDRHGDGLDRENWSVQQNRAMHFRNAQQLIAGHIVSQIAT